MKNDKHKPIEIHNIRGFEMYDKMEKIVSAINTWGSVVILGAGASYQVGMPLCGQLAPLVWIVFEQNQEIMISLKKEFNCPNTMKAKEIIGNDFQNLKRAFQIIAQSSDATRMFKEGFAKLNSRHEKSELTAYTALAMLIHEGFVDCVISFNWDCLLETAWTRLYGTDINDDHKVIYKPHGSVGDINKTWTLPNSDGNIEDDIIEELHHLKKDNPRVLLVVGYSESDKVIVDQIIKPFSELWQVIRVSPSTTGEEDLNITANAFFTGLQTSLCNNRTMKYWEHVDFSIQKDLLDAIQGNRLLPKNVSACVELPQVSQISKHLEVCDSAIISGGAGSGKSITAYQVAYHFLKKGWEILKYIHNENYETEIDRLRYITNKTVLIIDDTQLLSPILRDKLLCLASKRLKVICTITEMVDNDIRDLIYISNEQAVESLAAEYLRRKNEIYSIVKAFDNRIGDGYGDTTIESRIDEAAKANTPWMFNYILKGGWNNAVKDFTRIKEHNRADWVVVLLAVLQLLYLDKTVTKSQLEAMIADIEQNENWLNDQLSYLQKIKIIFNENSNYRCCHIKYATTMIDVFISQASKEEIDKIVKVSKKLLINSKTPMLGISWFLRHFHYSAKWGAYIYSKLIEKNEWNLLMGRCFSVQNDIDIRDSVFVQTILIRYYRGGAEEICNNHGRIIAKWIECVAKDTGYAFASFINDVYNESPSFLRPIVNEIDISKLSHRINTCTLENIGAVGHLLDRFWCFKSKEFMKCLSDQVDILQITDLIKKNAYNIDLWDLCSFIYGIYSINRDKGIELYDRYEEVFMYHIKNNPLETYEIMDDRIIWIILGYSIFAYKLPNKELRERAKRLVNNVPIKTVASGVSKSNRHDWERYARFIGWISRVDKTVTKEIADRVDYSEMDKVASQYWKQPPRELRLIAATLAEGSRNKEPVKSWIVSNMSEIEVIDPLIGSIAPEGAISVLNNGGKIDIFAHNNDFSLAAYFLTSIFKIDPNAAKAILMKSKDEVVDEVTNLWPLDCEDLGIYYFINIADKIDCNYIDLVFQEVDVTIAKQRWKDCVKKQKSTNRGRMKNILRSMSTVCSRAVKSANNELALLAEEVLRDIPS